MMRVLQLFLFVLIAATPAAAQPTRLPHLLDLPLPVEEPEDEFCRPELWVDDPVAPSPTVAGELSGGAATTPDDASSAIGRAKEDGSTDWNKTMLQSLFFTGVMHGYRIWYEPDTRAALGGPFFKDYFRAVRHLRGWSDGDNFLTNYIGHPMMGATAGRILLQNTPREGRLEPGLNREYLRSRMKAFGYSTLFSLQFEVGLISEGTIGHAMPNEHSRTPFSYQDLVITPTLGTAWLVGEDVLDRYLLRRIERWTGNRPLRMLARSILNPTRGMANLMRLKWPWYRDDRPL